MAVLGSFQAPGRSTKLATRSTITKKAWKREKWAQGVGWLAFDVKLQSVSNKLEGNNGALYG